MVWTWGYEVFVLTHVQSHQHPEGGTEDMYFHISSVEYVPDKVGATLFTMTTQVTRRPIRENVKEPGRHKD